VPCPLDESVLGVGVLIRLYLPVLGEICPLLCGDGSLLGVEVGGPYSGLGIASNSPLDTIDVDALLDGGTWYTSYWYSQ